MGSEISRNQMTRVIKDLLKSNGTAIKDSTAKTYVETMLKVSPWFLEEGFF